MAWQRPVSVLLVCLVLWHWGGAAWIHLKAHLAQYLIADAWRQTLEGHQAVKPWPWADTWPVARLEARNQVFYVLAGAQGHSLAFGPGHLTGTAMPGEGVSVIGGHRDTHFRFLRHAVPGDSLQLQTRQGEQVRYRIAHIRVVDSRYEPLVLDDTQEGLLLVTCYPFDALSANGPLRLLVWAEKV